LPPAPLRLIKRDRDVLLYSNVGSIQPRKRALERAR